MANLLCIKRVLIKFFHDFCNYCCQAQSTWLYYQEKKKKKKEQERKKKSQETRVSHIIISLTLLKMCLLLFKFRKQSVFLARSHPSSPLKNRDDEKKST